MADYYDSFSFVLPLVSAAEADWWRRVLERIHASVLGDRLAPDTELDRHLARIPELEYSSDLGAVWGIEAEITPLSETTLGRVWFHSLDGNPNVVALARLLQAFLRAFARAEGYGIEYAFTCSKPRTDGFGGAAVWVTARRCSWLSTHAWLERHAGRHGRRLRARCAAPTSRAASPASGPDAPGRGEGEREEVIEC